MKDPHLISVDELRAAGALDVPPEWRKSLGGKRKPKNLLLFGDDDTQPAEQPAPAEHPTPCDPDGDESVDESR